MQLFIGATDMNKYILCIVLRHKICAKKASFARNVYLCCLLIQRKQQYLVPTCLLSNDDTILGG